VIRFLNTPVRRIAFAIAISAFVHAIVLWLPYIKFPHAKVDLPPLTVRLEQVEKSVEASSAQPIPDNPIAIGENGTLAASAPLAAVTMKKMRASNTDKLFPKHVQLTFIAYQGVNASRVGEVHHQLDVEQDRYTLHVETKTTTLTGLLKAKNFMQTSEGKFGEHGLQPEFFKEETVATRNVKSLETRFDWVNQTLYFPNGNKTALLAESQDMLSFMYQLSQIPFNGEFFPLPISDGEQLTTQQIEIGAIDDLDTPMGKIQARHLRQMHERQTPYFEIWLAPEYRMLPVKFRLANEAEETIEEFVIADIRVADK
jgi:Protein of unknown function (DUF3108)